MATNATVCWALQVHKAQVEVLNSNRIQPFNYFLCVLWCVLNLHTEISLWYDSMIFTLFLLAEFWCGCVGCLTSLLLQLVLEELTFSLLPKFRHAGKNRHGIQNALFFYLNI